MNQSSTTPSLLPLVYVVDQDLEECERLVRLLTAAGLDSEAYESAEHFLERFDPARLGCLVTELELPGLNGLELLDRLQEREIELPAVVLARHGDVELAVRAMRSGAVDFLEKPFVDRVLLKRVLQILGREAIPNPALPAPGITSIDSGGK